MNSGPMGAEQNENAEPSVKSRTIEKDLDFDQWVSFNINDELFAVDALHVREVLKYSPITPVPGSDKYVCGLINLRGKVVTVIDTRIMFGLPERTPDDHTNIVLVDFNEEEMVGFVVDSVDEVINIMTKNIGVAPRATEGDTKNGFVKGVTFYHDSMIICLDIKKIISYVTPALEDDSY